MFSLTNLTLKLGHGSIAETTAKHPLGECLRSKTIHIHFHSNEDNNQRALKDMPVVNGANSDQ